MAIQINEQRDNVRLDREANDCVLDLNIGWKALKDIHATTTTTTTKLEVSHKQISERFVELLGLFEAYTKIVQESEHVQPKLRRSQSEQCLAAAEADSRELVRGSNSLSRLHQSDSTLLATSTYKRTCEVGIQTHYPIILAKKQLEQVKNNQTKFDQHTLHIEVESITSTSALERAPLRERMWQVLTEVGHTIESGFTMMGENITYVLFILLCMWCLYQLIEYYSSFLGAKKIPMTK